MFFLNFELIDPMGGLCGTDTSMKESDVDTNIFENEMKINRDENDEPRAGDVHKALDDLKASLDICFRQIESCRMGASGSTVVEKLALIDESGIMIPHEWALQSLGKLDECLDRCIRQIRDE